MYRSSVCCECVFFFYGHLIYTNKQCLVKHAVKVHGAKGAFKCEKIVNSYEDSDTDENNSEQENLRDSGQTSVVAGKKMRYYRTRMSTKVSKSTDSGDDMEFIVTGVKKGTAPRQPPVKLEPKVEEDFAAAEEPSVTAMDCPSPTLNVEDSDDEIEYVCETQKATFKCGTCNKTFRHEEELNEHFDQFHSTNQDVELVSDNSEPPDSDNIKGNPEKHPKREFEDSIYPAVELVSSDDSELDDNDSTKSNLEESSQLSPSKALDDDEGLLQCKMCPSRRFVTKECLEKHVAKNHGYRAP